MEPQPGIRDEPQDQAPGKPAIDSEEPMAGLLDSAGRFLGFLMFAGPAVLILAALLLLPLYKHWAMLEYEVACKQTLMDEKNLLLDCRSRVIRDAAEDEVLTARVLMGQSSMTPANMTVVEVPGLPQWSPMMVNPIKLPPPPPPSTTKAIHFLGLRLNPIEMANKLENPTTQRGLILVMLGAGLAAIFLFGPPAPVKKPRA
jgi:hypothetical protein